MIVARSRTSASEPNAFGNGSPHGPERRCQMRAVLASAPWRYGPSAKAAGVWATWRRQTRGPEAHARGLMSSGSSLDSAALHAIGGSPRAGCGAIGLALLKELRSVARGQAGRCRAIAGNVLQMPGSSVMNPTTGVLGATRADVSRAGGSARRWQGLSAHTRANPGS